MKNTTPTTTYLSLENSLPLTCTRAGTCCHGKMVWLNPWELACLAVAKGCTAREFRDRYCEFGGIRLRFDGPPGWKELPACSQYLQHNGCSVHSGRPLSCRLFPLGRELRGATHRYMHRGRRFPCLEGCPEAEGLPHLTVAEYLAVQEVSPGQAAQDAYVELMEKLADGAFALLLETDLTASGDRLTLRLWRNLGNKESEKLAEHLGTAWIDRLMLPEISSDLDNPVAFSQKHYDQLQKQAQAAFGSAGDFAALREASGVLMGLALHLGRGLGIQPSELARQWITTAKQHGARE